jgi:hypothetical protein
MCYNQRHSHRRTTISTKGEAWRRRNMRVI